MSNEWLGKVPNFFGAIANGVWYRPEKLQVGPFRPPTPVIRLNRQSNGGSVRSRLPDNYEKDNDRKLNCTCTSLKYGLVIGHLKSRSLEPSVQLISDCVKRHKIDIL